MSDAWTIADVLEGRSSWAVVTGDCLRVLPTLNSSSIAAIVTDSPYGISHKCNFAERGRGNLAACEEALATIVTMPVDGCCPSVIESMLRQAKSLACTVLQDRGAKQPKATASDVCSTTEKKRKGGMR